MAEPAEGTPAVLTPSAEPAAAPATATLTNLEPGATNWYASDSLALPQEIQDSPFVQRQPDLTTALKSLDHQGRTLSGKLTDKPTDDAPKESWDKFYGELGRPEKEEGYAAKFTKVGEDGKPVEIEPDEGQQKVVDRMKQLAYNSGLTQRQFDSVFEQIINEETELHEASNSPEVAAKELKEVWGRNYTENIAQAEQGWKSLPKPIQESLMGLPLAARSQIGAHVASLSRESVMTAGVGTPTGPRSLEAVNAEINDLQSGNHKDYEGALDDRIHPKHKSANAHFKKLIEERGRIK